MVNKRPNNNLKKPRRLVRLRWAILIVALIVIILLAGVLYSQRRMISSLLTGSHFVGGNADFANLHLPPGFQANVFYSGLKSPRFIAFSPGGTLFVAERGAGSIVALPGPDHTGKATGKK
jgi:glucose/arabinose dehydrogenase